MMKSSEERVAQKLGVGDIPCLKGCACLYKYFYIKGEGGGPGLVQSLETLISHVMHLQWKKTRI